MTSRPRWAKAAVVVPWLNWIEQPPPKGQVAGSNPAGITSLRPLRRCQDFAAKVAVDAIPMERRQTPVKLPNFLARRRPPSKEDAAAAALLEMIDRTQATIRFTPDGQVVDCNQNFLDTLGYRREEVIGRHHSMFVDPGFAASSDYARFWSDLRDGKAFTDQFPRRSKTGRTVWIQATYAPVRNDAGKVDGVVKIATDISARRELLDSLAQSLTRLSEGDLTTRFEDSDIPDIKCLGSAFNVAIDRLERTMRTARDVSEAVSQTADEITQASGDLSHRTESQAATLEQTAAAVEQLTQTVRSAAESARQVASSVEDAEAAAGESGAVMEQAIAAMSKIERSAEEIAKIIGVIDDIAFQTNLLALNAGVEAARAGEAGRGFAVVASEVRLLAQRATEAAGEIKQIISESGRQVSEGVGLVTRTGDGLKRIVDGVAIISRHIGTIATGADEQATSLAEVNTAVAQLDQVAQQNAAMVEETTAASQTLSGDARQLAAEISSFRVGHAGASSGDWSAGSRAA